MKLISAAISLAISVMAGESHACDAKQTIVSEVYPTNTELPANLLRFYIYFSAPMGQNDILPAIDLLDENDEIVSGVFLSNRFDLWSADRTRLTLLLDPGRVKTGLAANVSLGRALEAGKAYRLRISDKAEDAKSCQLAAPHVVSFAAVAADVQSPIPSSWDITFPDAGTRSPMSIRFDGTLDHLSLAYRLRVIGPDGPPLAGHISLDNYESTWLFTPAVAWKAAEHKLVIDPLLEDLAGNRMDAVFDLDLSAGGQSMAPGTSHTIPFTPHPS